MTGDPPKLGPRSRGVPTARPYLADKHAKNMFMWAEIAKSILDLTIFSQLFRVTDHIVKSTVHSSILLIDLTTCGCCSTFPTSLHERMLLGSNRWPGGGGGTSQGSFSQFHQL